VAKTKKTKLPGVRLGPAMVDGKIWQRTQAIKTSDLRKLVDERDQYEIALRNLFETTNSFTEESYIRLVLNGGKP
jgi:hypothetical protein